MSKVKIKIWLYITLLLKKWLYNANVFYKTNAITIIKLIWFINVSLNNALIFTFCFSEKKVLLSKKCIEVYKHCVSCTVVSVCILCFASYCLQKNSNRNNNYVTNAGMRKHLVIFALLRDENTNKPSKFVIVKFVRQVPGDGAR